MKNARTEELPCTEATALGEAELLVILERVTGHPATTKPMGKKAGDRKPNDFGVSYRLQLADRIERRRSACTGPSAAEPRLSVADALVHAIKSACKELGLHEPVELNGGTAPSTEAELAPTAAELDYLVDFLDQHAAPETVTVEMADAALRARRAPLGSCTGNANGAGSSTCRAAQPSAMVLLQQAQVLRAQLRAAERRAERAQQHLERCHDDLVAHHPPKAARHKEPTTQDHPRVAQGGSNPSGWNFFSGYSRAKYQEEEVKEQDRRAVEIDQSKRERRRPPSPALPLTPCAPTHASVARAIRTVRLQTIVGDSTGGGASTGRCVVGLGARWAPSSSCSPRARATSTWSTRSGTRLAFFRRSRHPSRPRLCPSPTPDLTAPLALLTRLPPPLAQTRQAETCIYAMGRARDLISRVKWSKTEEQRQDYHTVLTALAARRKEGDPDPDGMVERVAAELGVTAGTRYVHTSTLP